LFSKKLPDRCQGRLVAACRGSAIVTDNNGVKFTLHQDGDLWLIPQGMEWSDENETFQWPEDA